MATKIFVNLPVKDVGTSIDFSTRLGFPFHPEFTNERVDQVVDDALAHGAEQMADVVDGDFMYGRGFHDLDGHLWNMLAVNDQGEAMKGAGR